MLDVDVLILIYHMAKICEGGILDRLVLVRRLSLLWERVPRREKKFISIEPGGEPRDQARESKHLQRLTKRFTRRLANAVSLLNGASFDQKIIATVKEHFARMRSASLSSMPTPTSGATSIGYGDRLPTAAGS